MSGVGDQVSGMEAFGRGRSVDRVIGVLTFEF